MNAPLIPRWAGAMAASVLLAASATAQTGTISPPASRNSSGEQAWLGYGNKPAPVSGTHESREAERHAHRQQMKEANTHGELPGVGEAYGVAGSRAPAAMAPSSPAQRHAERVMRHEEIKGLVRAGEMPVTNEAGVSQPAR